MYKKINNIKCWVDVAEYAAKGDDTRCTAYTIETPRGIKYVLTCSGNNVTVRKTGRTKRSWKKEYEQIDNPSLRGIVDELCAHKLLPGVAYTFFVDCRSGY